MIERPQTYRARRWMFAAAFILLFSLASTFYAVTNWPFSERAIAQTLEHRFARSVVIHKFHATYFPPGCVAEDVDFLHRKRKDLPPLIQAKRITIRASYLGLLPFNQHIPDLEVTGLHVTVPPKTDHSSPTAVMPLTDEKSSVPINIIKVDGALLEFRSSDPAREPFKIVIHKLVLENVGNRGPMTYHATIKNTEPPGEISATGKFGPWVSDDIGITPLSGTYVYGAADLGFFPALAGALSSKGEYSGTLALLKCNGTADVAGFKASATGRPVRLVTDFEAQLDATNGDTLLQNVRAAFLRTSISTKGNISTQSGAHGKAVELLLNVSEGRVDDFLALLGGGKSPSMTGGISLQAKAVLPPGQEKFLSRLILDGDFGIDKGRFTNAALQTPINHVSSSARGENKRQEMEDPTTALSKLTGHVSVKAGVATLSNISFAVSGGSAKMKGTFDLLSSQVNIKGVLYTDGNLSDATSGFKAIVLKLVVPFTKKKRTTIIPFTITGTSQEPRFALDFDGSRKL